MLGFMSAMNDSMSPSVSDRPTSSAICLSWLGVGTLTGMGSSLSLVEIDAPGRAGEGRAGQGQGAR